MRHTFTSATFVRLPVRYMFSSIRSVYPQKEFACPLLQHTFTSVGSVYQLKEFACPLIRHTFTSIKSISPPKDWVSGITQHTFIPAEFNAPKLISEGRIVQHMFTSNNFVIAFPESQSSFVSFISELAQSTTYKIKYERPTKPNASSPINQKLNHVNFML